MGHILSASEMQPDPDNVAKVKNQRPRQDVSEVRQFLGLASYYQKFIAGFATIAAPLTKLLRKGEDFQWALARGKAFRELYELVSTAHILAIFTYSLL